MLLAVLAVLPLRFARSRRDEERLAAEMESARTVQQVLIPTEIPTVSGFDIQCVYKPAGHVGGDFFQIIPIASGGLLIAMGDVSGKGMPAAMTVSLLVGTLRTLAHFTHSPSEILDAMNQRMLARSKGGFTTCLVLRAAPDYTLTVANAGHLAPYLQGTEVEISNGLPLGLAEESAYPETALTLPENAQLTLLTDGVVEARARTGELLGFERTATLSTQTAEVDRPCGSRLRARRRHHGFDVVSPTSAAVTSRAAEVIRFNLSKKCRAALFACFRRSGRVVAEGKTSRDPDHDKLAEANRDREDLPKVQVGGDLRFRLSLSLDRSGHRTIKPPDQAKSTLIWPENLSLTSPLHTPNLFMLC